MKGKEFKYKSVLDSDPYGILNIFNLGEIPFNVKRIFTVSTDSGITRGYHAHLECNQLLVCISGKIEITTDDSKIRTKTLLEPNGKSLLIPAGIWAEQKYIKPNSILVTFCDQDYDENDYIRDYELFKKKVKK